jgi:hypothetical protein
MKRRQSKAEDADLSGAAQALRRAAARAKRLAEDTATPFYILKGGRVVDLNPQGAGACVLRERGPRK